MKFEAVDDLVDDLAFGTHRQPDDVQFGPPDRCHGGTVFVVVPLPKSAEVKIAGDTPRSSARLRVRVSRALSAPNTMTGCPNIGA